MSHVQKSQFFLVRWLKFNMVGAAGVLVQLAILRWWVNCMNYGYLLGTLVAVETTLLHNFTWHWFFTWKDRPATGAHALLDRLFRFHAGNGMVSLIGNVLLMWLLVGLLGLRLLVANCVAILVCSTVNYLLGDRFVFRANWMECRNRAPG